MVMTAISALIFIIGIANICHPINTLWGESNGVCNLQLNSDVSLFFSAVEIATDWTLAILPAVLLRNIQMKSRVKISVACILGLAALWVLLVSWVLGGWMRLIYLQCKLCNNRSTPLPITLQRSYRVHVRYRSHWTLVRHRRSHGNIRRISPCPSTSLVPSLPQSQYHRKFQQSHLRKERKCTANPARYRKEIGYQLGYFRSTGRFGYWKRWWGKPETYFERDKGFCDEC